MKMFTFLQQLYDFDLIYFSHTAYNLWHIIIMHIQTSLIGRRHSQSYQKYICTRQCKCKSMHSFRFSKL